MNYLKEILAFNEWAEINRLAISDFRLWHALMECNNRLGWCEWFQVPVIMLESKTGLEARTLSNAKNRLVKSGRLALRRGRGSRGAEYRLIPFFGGSEDNQAAIDRGMRPADTSGVEEGSGSPDRAPGDLPGSRADPPASDRVSDKVSGKVSDKASASSSGKASVKPSDKAASSPPLSPLPPATPNPPIIPPILGNVNPNKTKTGERSRAKTPHGEYANVLLSLEDLEKLRQEVPDWQMMIERLSGYMQSTGKQYKDHLATLKNWARKDKENERNQRNNQGNTGDDSAEDQDWSWLTAHRL